MNKPAIHAKLKPGVKLTVAKRGGRATGKSGMAHLAQRVAKLAAANQKLEQRIKSLEQILMDHFSGRLIMGADNECLYRAIKKHVDAHG